MLPSGSRSNSTTLCKQYFGAILKQVIKKKPCLVERNHECVHTLSKLYRLRKLLFKWNHSAQCVHTLWSKQRRTNHLNMGANLICSMQAANTNTLGRINLSWVQIWFVASKQIRNNLVRINLLMNYEKLSSNWLLSFQHICCLLPGSLSSTVAFPLQTHESSFNQKKTANLVNLEKYYFISVVIELYSMPVLSVFV